LRRHWINHVSQKHVGHIAGAGATKDQLEESRGLNLLPLIDHYRSVRSALYSFGVASELETATRWRCLQVGCTKISGLRPTDASCSTTPAEYPEQTSTKSDYSRAIAQIVKRGGGYPEARDRYCSTA